MSVSSCILTCNGKVACAPFPATVVEKETRGGMVVVKQKGTLTKLEVVFPDDDYDYEAKSFIWVRAESFILNWAKEVFEVDGVKFILVPKDQILMSQS